MSMNNNRILEKIRKKEIANVVSIKSENLDIIEYASKLNYDAIHLDAEHGSFSVDSIENICQLAISCGLTVTARIHKISKQEINLFIDRAIEFSLWSVIISFFTLLPREWSLEFITFFVFSIPIFCAILTDPIFPDLIKICSEVKLEGISMSYSDIFLPAQ